MICSSIFSMKLNKTLSKTPQTDVIKAIFAPLITPATLFFISLTSTLPAMFRSESPSCKPTKVPMTPKAVKKPGTAAIIRFSVLLPAKLVVLKK